MAHALSSRVTQVQSTISSVYNSASIRGMYQLAKTAVVGSPPVAASDSGTAIPAGFATRQAAMLCAPHLWLPALLMPKIYYSWNLISCSSSLPSSSGLTSPLRCSCFAGLLPPEDTSGDVPVGETCRVWRTLTDPARAVSAILPSPSGGLLVAMDQLGRILMLDSPSFLVLRVWKVPPHPFVIRSVYEFALPGIIHAFADQGYRDAMCGWAELPADPSAGGGSSSSSASTDVVLCLAIYAPRKSLVEIWQVAGHVRRCAFSCSPGCRLIQPEVAFGSQAAPGKRLFPSCWMIYLLNAWSFHDGANVALQSSPLLILSALTPLAADGRLLAPVGRQTCFMMDQFNGLVDIAQHARSALGI